MRLTRNLDDRLPECQRAVVAGAFDGVHSGHQFLFRQTCAEAADAGLESSVFTFEPIPQEFLSPDTSLRIRLTVGDERVEIMRQLCVDRLIVAPFDAPFSRLTAEQFVSEILVGRLNARILVAAENHAFGHGAGADIEAIAGLAQQYDLRLVVVPLLRLDGTRVSSTEVRRLLREGHVEKAGGLLGRHYSMCGEVVAGKGIGRDLGFATANLEVARNKLIPAAGVYAALADSDVLREQLSPMSGPYPAAVSIGPQPTFGVTVPRIEAHVIAAAELELRGSSMELRFVRRLRPVQKFDTVDALKAQMARDVEATVNLVGDGC